MMPVASVNNNIINRISRKLNFFFLMTWRPPVSTLFPYTTLFRSGLPVIANPVGVHPEMIRHGETRSEEHTSELQSRQYLVCRLLLEKKKAPEFPKTMNKTAKNPIYSAGLFALTLSIVASRTDVRS